MGPLAACRTRWHPQLNFKWRATIAMLTASVAIVKTLRDKWRLLERGMQQWWAACGARAGVFNAQPAVCKRAPPHVPE